MYFEGSMESMYIVKAILFFFRFRVEIYYTRNRKKIHRRCSAGTGKILTEVFYLAFCKQKKWKRHTTDTYAIALICVIDFQDANIQKHSLNLNFYFRILTCSIAYLDAKIQGTCLPKMILVRCNCSFRSNAWFQRSDGIAKK